MELAVIICTHNPRHDYFSRVLDALRDQTLPKDQWELIVVDNASRVPLASEWDLSWHPNGRHVVESELGLASARRRGMREATCDVLVFVDDDNVLDSMYLAEALLIKLRWPVLGAWGAGVIIPEFEIEPSDQIKPFLQHLALRNEENSCWTNVFPCWKAAPWGAGLCVRAEVAFAYRHLDHSALEITDRKGASLASGGDAEISYVACSIGFGIGIFPTLRMRHLIPKERLSTDYLVGLKESLGFADVLLTYKWEGKLPRSPFSPLGILRVLGDVLRVRGMSRRMYLANLGGTIRARRLIATAGRR